MGRGERMERYRPSCFRDTATPRALAVAIVRNEVEVKRVVASLLALFLVADTGCIERRDHLLRGTVQDLSSSPNDEKSHVDLCVPDCIDKNCGPDGCGGSCGQCYSMDGALDDSLCMASGKCCVPDCAGLECFHDGCGGLCGECTTCKLVCALGKCEAQPKTASECKDGDIYFKDSCGVWGEVASPCGAEGCDPGSELCFGCEKTCQQFKCGEKDDCYCGACGAGTSCQAGQCIVVCGDEQCGNDEDQCSCPADCSGGCTGCCSDKVCKAGTSNDECGKNGAACKTCSDGMACQPSGSCSCQPNDHQACDDGKLYQYDSCGMKQFEMNNCDDGNPCTKDSCPDSSCNHTNLPNGTDCGGVKKCQNGACMTPSPECGDGECNGTDNQCKCPEDCGICSGCCSGSKCELGTSDALCGKKGAACVACPGGNSCQGGKCEVKCGDGVCAGGWSFESECSCPEDCGLCAGCCSWAVCESGTSADSCGKKGAECGNCAADDQSCVSQQCQCQCGDGMCCDSETCSTCPDDCGECLSEGGVFITEIMYNPKQLSDVGGEWFEVHNSTSSAVDVEGWLVLYKDYGFQINNGGIGLEIPPKGYLVFVVSPDALSGMDVPCYGYFAEFNLSDSTPAPIGLYNVDGILIDEALYQIEAAYNGAAAQLSNVPELYNSTANDEPANYCAAAVPYETGDYGSPGMPNVPCP